MLFPFTFAISISLITLSLAQNVTIDDTNEAIIYEPPDAWTQLRSKETKDRYMRTTSYTYDVNATATFTFQGTGIWWMSYGLNTNHAAVVTLDGINYYVSLDTGVIRPQAVLWGQSDLSLNQVHTVVVNNRFGSPLNVDAFIVKQFVAPTADVPSLAQATEALDDTNSKGGGNSPGLIAALTVSAFIVGMLFAFLTCYIHRSRRLMKGDGPGHKPRDTSTPTRGNATTNSSSRNPSPQDVIPWEAEYHSEGRDRVLDLAGPTAASSRWRQRFSRAMFPNSRYQRPTGSRTVVTESNLESDQPSSPTTLLSPSGMTLSSYFYAPSTMPSIGGSRTRDRHSLLTE